MSVAKAVSAFESGRLVAIPTETVYGLAAPVDSLDLVRKIFLMKERPYFDPLIVHVSNPQMATKYAREWPLAAQLLAEAFWPGPLSLVLPKKPSVDDLITSGLSTVALRAPSHPLTLELIDELGQGLAAPSANKFTKVSPTSPDHVRNSFTEEEVYILDGGDCVVGIESTIVEISEENLKILRPGMITEDSIKAVTSLPVEWGRPENKVSAPGQLKEHYKPDCPLVITDHSLDAPEWETVAKRLSVDQTQAQKIFLDKEAPLAARQLYSNLRKSLKTHERFKLIEIPAINQNPQWHAIIDRLQKAATVVFINSLR